MRNAEGEGVGAAVGSATAATRGMSSVRKKTAAVTRMSTPVPVPLLHALLTPLHLGGET
ncbi:hypothetical protein [Microbacterium sp. HMWF026]|uniref:hypothetical protein n=1 Tax=Microbacterium sp. HMWF026 TaxID=2056861 RepID=UPI0015E7F849|nr:hypothetical protein [Microbacterium sp. HMWF026]